MAFKGRESKLSERRIKMSVEYSDHLCTHKHFVTAAFNWIKENLPELIIPMDGVDYELNIRYHDFSKSSPEEYDAYDRYYSNNKINAKAVVDAFNKARLHHIRNNPHHYEYWAMIDNRSGQIITIDMPYQYIVEMVCDWWSFGFRNNNLYEVFLWYEKHKGSMKLSVNTRATVEGILSEIKTKLDELKNDETCKGISEVIF